MKIDVEGAEMLVIDGAVRTIERCKPIIICELVESQLNRFSTSIAEVKGRLTDLGYVGEPLLPTETRDWLFVYSRE